MSECGGISVCERYNPLLHPSGAGSGCWYASDDITPEKIDAIIETVQDLFT